MFDDFRDQVDESDFDEAEPATTLEDLTGEVVQQPAYFLGMTPVQRFIISVELLFMVCVAGALILIVLGRVELPF